MQSNPVSWSARWISSTVIGGPRVNAPVPYFRTAFRIDSPVRSAILHVTALGIYECEINGQLVGEDVFAPGWSEYTKRVCYQSHDVASLLKSGDNALGVILGDGWYSGHVGWGDRQQYGERPQFLLQLEITAQDGSVQRVVSDSTWKTAVGPILESDLQMGETYDARRELGAWSSAPYDDGSWLAAVLAPNPGIVIERSPGPPVRRQETLSVQTTKTPEANRHRFDFGQNFTGRIRLTVRGTRGTRLVIRYAEVLNPDGSLYTENLRAARATDSYTLKGDATEKWESRFTFHGFRHVEVAWAGKAEDLVIEKLEGIVLQSDMPRAGTFRCSHELLNQLESNIIWGQKGNFLEVPTDCPQRDERLGWTGDAQVFIRTAAFHFDVHSFFRKWFRDMRDAQSSNGAIPSVIPNPVIRSWMPDDGGPAWADAVFICPWTIYRCYDDVEILRDNYDCMARYLDYLAQHKVKDFIRAHPDVDTWGGYGDWLALDGSGKTDGGTAKDLIGTAHYANDAHIMAETAQVLGKTGDVKKYRELHGKIVEAFRNRYVTPDGLMAGGTQTAYVLGLHFGLIPPAARATAARELVRNIERNGMHLATGFVGTPYLLHVLEAHGHLDVAYKLLEQETFPSWLFPVKNGATTIWERWDGWTPEKGFQDKGMNSFNHYAYGAVADWMVSTVAGLEIAEPGYKKILFKPRPGGTITFAEAKLQTPHGEAAIRWELVGNALKLHLTVPQGSEAVLSLPQGWKADSTTFAPGKHEITAKS
jgi:alpha-L-rhamnosidase